MTTDESPSPSPSPTLLAGEVGETRGTLLDIVELEIIICLT